MPLPDSDSVKEAVAHVQAVLHPQIFNHSIRTYLLGRIVADQDGVDDLDIESLCIAALFHDSGTAVVYDGPARFEVEGADAAAKFLEQCGWSAAAVDPIWEAIALHTTPGIPERRGPIAQYLRRGVEIEFGSAELRASLATSVADAEMQYPRVHLEETLQTLVVQQALRQPQKATAPSWAADLVRHHQPGRPGVNPGF
ncbi:HD domain-containing protein [Mycolicibacterium sp. P9-64]|uniref:HD domain-containing protein n=1 Tax=Mycolicibacterium sp. P9-64 TaxID=2024612 RepID=UPI0011ECD81F|nr:HD domain-containing protein [Mycolicibacterium sp. P9-64]KAA0082483.1 HD domain-containing protein [Mycolicibacterium sp. P9-64]